MEITIISAEGLKNKSSSLFPRRLRPFVTLTVPPFVTDGDKPSHVYKTRVDDEGGLKPKWGDKFHIPTHHANNFLYQRQYSYIYLQVFTKQTLLGCCQIPAADVVDGFSPVGSVRRLSYRLRDKDGSRGHGIINVAVKLDSQRSTNSDLTHLSEMGFGQTVIGIPVTMLPVAGVCQEPVCVDLKIGK